MVDRDKMTAQLLLHEGCVLHPYIDTEENCTIGVGFNVTARGWPELERMIGRTIPLDGPPCAGATNLITRAEALSVLAQDIQRVQRAVMVYFPPFIELNEVRQRVVVDMAFNLGFRALQFKKCIAAIEKKNWSVAARELLKSKWHGQVGSRADRLAHMLLTGEDTYAEQA